MSKTLIVGDVHLHNWPAFSDPTGKPGVNTRAQLVLNCVSKAVEIANTHRCEKLVFLGDIFETHKPSIQLQSALADILYCYGGTTVMVLGNHDRTSMNAEDHALAMFKWVRGVWIATAPTRALDMVLIPWSTSRPTVELDKLMEGRDLSKPLVLCLHAGLYDKIEGFRPEQGDTKAHDAIEVNELVDVCRKYNIRRVFSGHWHAHREYTDGPELTITQLGALVPSGFNNAESPSRYGNCVIVNDDLTYERVSIPGPRFLRDKTIAGMRDQIISANLTGHDHLYASIKPPIFELPKVRDALTTWLGMGDIKGFVVEPSLESVRDAADQIRQSISRDSAENAITDFIADSAPNPNIASQAARMAVTAWKRS